jgi:hypothetical protein
LNIAVQKGTVQVDDLDIPAKDKACTDAGKPKPSTSAC